MTVDSVQLIVKERRLPPQAAFLIVCESRTLTVNHQLFTVNLRNNFGGQSI